MEDFPLHPEEFQDILIRFNNLSKEKDERIAQIEEEFLRRLYSEVIQKIDRLEDYEKAQLFHFLESEKEKGLYAYRLRPYERRDENPHLFFEAHPLEIDSLKDEKENERPIYCFTKDKDLLHLIFPFFRFETVSNRSFHYINLEKSNVIVTTRPIEIKSISSTGHINIFPNTLKTILELAVLNSIRGHHEKYKE